VLLLWEAMLVALTVCVVGSQELGVYVVSQLTLDRDRLRLVSVALVGFVVCWFRDTVAHKRGLDCELIER